MSNKRIRELLERHEPKMRKAFLDAIKDIKENVEIGRLAKMLERGDVEGALRAVHLDPTSFSDFDAKIASAFTEGGRKTVESLPNIRDAQGGKVIVRFNLRNPRAETWLKDRSSTLITNIIDDQRSGIRTVLREGMESGRNPRSTALDLVGRINKTTGRREGGLIGLSKAQIESVQAARNELLSGDLGLMKKYLQRTLRDKRFDGVVHRAIADKKTVSIQNASKMIGRYSDRNLLLRGETIARTETQTALQQSQVEAFSQAVDTGAVRERDVRRVWSTAGDGRVRDTHSGMDGQSVGLNESFRSPSGALLRYPGDPNAPAEERINCRCNQNIRIDFLANAI